jgi:hypothetical protein
MTFRPATITTELLEHSDGRPVAYVDATAVAVFAYQQPDGSYLVEICTREDITDSRLRVLLDGSPLIRCSAVTNDHALLDAVGTQYE